MINQPSPRKGGRFHFKLPAMDKMKYLTIRLYRKLYRSGNTYSKKAARNNPSGLQQCRPNSGPFSIFAKSLVATDQCLPPLWPPPPLGLRPPPPPLGLKLLPLGLNWCCLPICCCLPS